MPGCLQVSSYPLIISLYAGRSLEENQGDSGGSWPWGNHDGIGCFFFREPVHKSEKPRRTIEKPQKNHRIDLKPTGRDDRYEVEGKTWLAWEATVAPSWSEGCHLAMFWQHSNFPRVPWPKRNQWRGSLHHQNWSKLFIFCLFLLLILKRSAFRPPSLWLRPSDLTEKILWKVASSTNWRPQFWKCT